MMDFSRWNLPDVESIGEKKSGIDTNLTQMKGEKTDSLEKPLYLGFASQAYPDAGERSHPALSNSISDKTESSYITAKVRQEVKMNRSFCKMDKVWENRGLFVDRKSLGSDTTKDGFYKRGLSKTLSSTSNSFGKKRWRDRQAERHRGPNTFYPSPRVRVRQEPVQSCKLCIRRLNPETTEDTLKSYFSKYGEVDDCIVIKYCLKNTCWGCVTYESEHMVDEAEAAGPHTIDGTEVEVYPAVRREKAISKEHSHGSSKRLSSFCSMEIEGETNAPKKKPLPGWVFQGYTNENFREGVFQGQETCGQPNVCLGFAKMSLDDEQEESTVEMQNSDVENQPPGFKLHNVLQFNSGWDLESPKVPARDPSDTGERKKILRKLRKICNRLRDYRSLERSYPPGCAEWKTLHRYQYSYRSYQNNIARYAAISKELENLKLEDARFSCLRRSAA